MTAEAAAIAGLADRIGRLEPGHVADVLVLERRHEDPWQNVLASDRSSVELVVVGGDLAYGRADWLRRLAPPGELAAAEEVSAWGKAMLLDTSYTAAPADAEPLRLGGRARPPARPLPAERADLRVAPMPRHDGARHTCRAPMVAVRARRRCARDACDNACGVTE